MKFATTMIHWTSGKLDAVLKIAYHYKITRGPCQSTVGYDVNVVERRRLATKKN